MRINVYSEEITDDVQFITKEDVIGEDGNLVTFYGVRYFLKSWEGMHHNEFDDDRSAITFWFRTKDARDVATFLYSGVDLISNHVYEAQESNPDVEALHGYQIGDDCIHDELGECSVIDLRSDGYIGIQSNSTGTEILTTAEHLDK